MSPVVAFREASVVRRWQAALVVLGVVLLAVGGLVLLADVSPRRYVGILVWFAGAIVLHDGIIAPIVFAVSLALRKAGRVLPRRRMTVILAILQGAVVVGAIVFLIVFPQIVKQQIGTPNPSVLPLDYTRNLVLFYVVLALITAAVIAIYSIVSARRQKTRPSTVQA